VSVERRPVHHGIASSAMPAGVTAAAVSEAGYVTDENLVRAEAVAVRAAGRRMRDPLPAAKQLHDSREFAENPLDAERTASPTRLGGGGPNKLVRRRTEAGGSRHARKSR
jgi:hypothetical protein